MLPAVTVWPRRRRRNCWLLLALAGLVLVSPLESGLLPGRLGEILEPARAAAQDPPPSFKEGVPDACPTAPFEWRPAGSECVLELPACPTSPLAAPGLMRLSAPTEPTRTAFGAGGQWEQPSNVDMTPPPWDGEVTVKRYPEFCEDWVPADGSDPDRENRCRALTGYVVREPVHDSGGTSTTYCRVLAPIECPAFTVTASDGPNFDVATHRIDVQSCRAVRRRAWTCDDGYLPSNAFKSCYRPAPELDAAPVCDLSSTDAVPRPCWADNHPACGQGAPAFPLGPSAGFLRAAGRTEPAPAAESSRLACAEYVGEDFFLVPAERPCSDFTTDSSSVNITFSDGADGHWCEYDSWMLRIECHQSAVRPADCAGLPASCIKRASRTGGCDQILDTIRCRILQAELSRGDSTLQEAQEEAQQVGCQPCQHLPFSEPPAQCAASGRRRPASPTGALERVLAVKRDYRANSADCRPVTTTAEYENNEACKRLPVCADPPKGRTTVTSRHQSGLAVVNSPVEVTVVDIPLALRRRPVVNFDRRGDPSSESIVFAGTYWNQHFTDAPADLGSVSKLTTLNLGDDSRQFDLESWPFSASECTLRDTPYFDLIVEELWPDHDSGRVEILRLFGADSLQWWEDLDDSQRRARTAARGLGWWEDLDSDGRDARRAGLTVQIQCARNDYRVCDWAPTRPGYFKLTAAGAWRMARAGMRRWWNAYDLRNVNEALTSSTIVDKTTRLVTQQGLTPQQVGIKNDYLGVLGMASTCGTGDPAWDPPNCPALGDAPSLFDEEHAPVSSCPAIDQRVRCSSSESYNYTETEPVGVIVHEVRVQTVMASE